MKRKLLIITGAVLIFSALCLCGYNISESRIAGIAADEVLTALVNDIPEPLQEASSDLFMQENSQSMPVLRINDTDYCGCISIPALDIELPVADDISDDSMKLSPCRYRGSIYNKDLIIAAHNYSTHFGSLRHLSNGDDVIFTDCTGKKHLYSVVQTEEISGDDPERMLSGSGHEWDITLFTCDLSGRNRITVRAAAKT